MSDLARARPTRTDLAVFGLVLPIIFALAGLFAWRHSTWPALAHAVWAIGAIVTLLYWSVRTLRWPLYEAWMTAVHPLGALMSRLLIAAVFFGLVTPIGLLARLLGRDPLGRRREPGRTSYWVAHRVGDGTEARRYLRQS